MTTLSNHKKIILTSVIILCICLILFVFLIFVLKFDKYYECVLYSDSNSLFLITNEKVFNFMNKTGNINIKYNDIYYSINYEFFNKYGDYYYYLTDFSKYINDDNICYIWVKNLSLFDLLKG